MVNRERESINFGDLRWDIILLYKSALGTKKRLYCVDKSY